MLDTAIRDFLDERKALWLKKKIKKNTSEEDEKAILQEADRLFSLHEWLPNAAKRAKQLSLVSHPAKFSHPSAKTSALIANAPRQADGYLRTGNVDIELDVFGNAAAMDVYKFLMLVLADNKTVLQHLEDDSDEIKQQFTFSDTSFEEIAEGLLEIKQSDTRNAKTSGSVKQVYFPIGDDEYHLLSVMTNSAMMYTLKARINAIRFSEDAKAAREAKRNNKTHETGYADFADLSAIGFGGTKPQNISVMNSQNGGVALLLASTPPLFEKRRINPPRDNFFGKFLNLKDYQEDFKAFHLALVKEINNRHTRKKVRWLATGIFYRLIDHSWKVRYLPAGWSASDYYQRLPQSQKIWLDQYYQEDRNTETQWLDDVKESATVWFTKSYKKLLGQQALSLSDIEFIHIKDWLEACEGGLK